MDVTKIGTIGSGEFNKFNNGGIPAFLLLSFYPKQNPVLQYFLVNI
uniref:Uncharacterized protein n=1 Tax=Brassica campestris TaxID=3711 RepID=A0A3P6DIX3_BRACM|nr:unnamed protein product [Brassica rapa]